jgi:hypothetical protein
MSMLTQLGGCVNMHIPRADRLRERALRQDWYRLSARQMKRARHRNARQRSLFPVPS